MAFARGIAVPLLPDYVGEPSLIFDEGIRCLLFPLHEDFAGEQHLGRVIFEGFDAIRWSRGEAAPYPDDALKSDAWTFVVEDSDWLRERHAYKLRNYNTPLLDEYDHYVFRFHDQFVELIAEGIWFDNPLASQGKVKPESHPALDLSASPECEAFSVDGMPCEVRFNPRPLEELLEDSKLGSQILFQYALAYGAASPSYAARLRTRQGRSRTRLTAGLFMPALAEVLGVASEKEFRTTFAHYASEVVQRRHAMGLPISPSNPAL